MQSLHDGSQFRHPDGFRWRPIFHHVVTQPCRLANPYVTRRRPIIPNTARGGSSFPVLDLIGWGHGGLDPVPLLHHRTCGFPHSAVELGATFSGCSKAKARYTYLAPACASSNKSPDFPLNNRKCPQTTSIMHPHSTAVRPLARLDQPLPPFRILSLSFSGELRSVFSSSSALRSGRLSAALFATTASDDSSSRLSPRRLPQVRCVNFRPAPPDSSRSGFRRRLDFAFSRTLIARIEPRCLFVFLRSCLGSDFFQLGPLRGRPCLSLRLSSLSPAISFQVTSSRPCWAHECGGMTPLWSRDMLARRSLGQRRGAARESAVMPTLQNGRPSCPPCCAFASMPLAWHAWCENPSRSRRGRPGF